MMPLALPSDVLTKCDEVTTVGEKLQWKIITPCKVVACGKSCLDVWYQENRSIFRLLHPSIALEILRKIQGQVSQRDG
jgi:hypothetical protein